MKFATRPSILARWQTRWTINALDAIWPNISFEETIITTSGDKILDRPLPEIGGKGLFTSELEKALVEGQVDAAVHSLKDLPVQDSPGITIAAIPVRAEVRDVLVSADGSNLDSLPEGARVGTSSMRRASQLLAYRPDLHPEPIRGNVDTRLRKVEERQYDAIVLASAGLVRLGLERYITQWLPLDLMLPAPGQGALAVQARAGDERTLALLAPLEDLPSRRAVEAERAFLSHLGGGCSLPVAAYAEEISSYLQLRGLVSSVDGRHVINLTGEGYDPQEVGKALAVRALQEGAASLLSSQSYS
jgi:hydroxymethylbilane synthase